MPSPQFLLNDNKELIALNADANSFGALFHRNVRCHL